MVTKNSKSDLPLTHFPNTNKIFFENFLKVCLNIFPVGGASNNNKHVKMKIVDEKLKIIDDVPTSAVEMAVKEKVCTRKSTLSNIIFQ